eukprot:PhF_6_TR25697/c0_g1_i2/m.36222
MYNHRSYSEEIVRDLEDDAQRDICRDLYTRYHPDVPTTQQPQHHHPPPYTYLSTFPQPPPVGPALCIQCTNPLSTYCEQTGCPHILPDYTPSEYELSLQHVRSEIAQIHEDISNTLYKPPLALEGSEDQSSPTKPGRPRRSVLRAHYHAIVSDFYQKYNPSKLSEVDDILDQFHGNEVELLLLLSIKYGGVDHALLMQNHMQS